MQRKLRRNYQTLNKSTSMFVLSCKQIMLFNVGVMYVIVNNCKPFHLRSSSK